MIRLYQNRPGTPNSKMWSAFIVRLKLPEIYILSPLNNCQLFPTLSGYD